MPEYDIIDVGSSADDPNADDLRTGGIKINDNWTRTQPQNVGFSSTLDFSGQRYMGVLNNTGVQTFTVGTSFVRGGRVSFEAIGDIDLRFPSSIQMTGRYDKARSNYIVIENRGGVTSGTAELVGTIVSQYRQPDTGLVLRHRPAANRNNLFDSISEGLSFNAGSSTPGSLAKFSKMSELEDFRWYDGFFYFRLSYFNLSGQKQGSDIVWRQRSNPADFAEGVDRVDDYLPISGTSQLNFTKAVGGTAVPGGLCLSVRNPKALYTMFPGETDENVDTSGTVGTTRYSPSENGTNNLYTPGVNSTDRAVELRAEAPV